MAWYNPDNLHDWSLSMRLRNTRYLTSEKPGIFGPKVLQIVDFLTGREILNLYGT
jgi:hypothetical protein